MSDTHIEMLEMLTTEEPFVGIAESLRMEWPKVYEAYSKLNINSMTAGQNIGIIILLLLALPVTSHDDKDKQKYMWSKVFRYFSAAGLMNSNLEIEDWDATIRQTLDQLKAISSIAIRKN